MRHDVSLFIFRRDLRIEDNTGLCRALLESKRVVPCFIFDPDQVEEHEYRSLPALDFMLRSLEELGNELEKRKGRLCLFQGRPEEVLAALLSRLRIGAVYINADYTPFSRRRDDAMGKVCVNYRAAFIRCGDSLLHEPGEVVKSDGAPYTVFTPFWRRAFTLPAGEPSPSAPDAFLTEQLPLEIPAPPRFLPRVPLAAPAFSGGRSEALSLLAGLPSLSGCDEERDVLALDSTTRLSPHLKFGTVSVREVYHAIRNELGPDSPVLRQLYWRDFYCHIAWHFPHVFQGSFHRKYDAVEWSGNPEAFDRWRSGRTGFPIVDAGMRQLAATGFMHNRARLITASFLVKDLHLDWRLGERHFARNLVDYDPAVNNGNWQWAASTGCDAQPYFRVFNPWLQQKRFDPDAAYIKRWAPELEGVEPEWIHRPNAGQLTHIGYPEPMVDHREAAAEARRMFAQAGASLSSVPPAGGGSR